MPRKRQPRLEPTRADAVETRSNLLEAAGEAFAEHGFQAAGLRNICDAARVNLGAVKYYFGSKENLYQEVLLEAYRSLIDQARMPTLADAPEPQVALRQWIDAFLRLALVQRPAHPYLGRLAKHEMINPTDALDGIVERAIKPVRDELHRIVRALAPDDTSKSETRRLAHFIMLLCMQYEIAQPILKRLGDAPPTTERSLKRLAEQIHRFALSGIKMRSP